MTVHDPTRPESAGLARPTRLALGVGSARLCRDERRPERLVSVWVSGCALHCTACVCMHSAFGSIAAQRIEQKSSHAWAGRWAARVSRQPATTRVNPSIGSKFPAPKKGMVWMAKHARVRLVVGANVSQSFSRQASTSSSCNAGIATVGSIGSTVVERGSGGSRRGRSPAAGLKAQLLRSC